MTETNLLFSIHYTFTHRSMYVAICWHVMTKQREDFGMGIAAHYYQKCGHMSIDYGLIFN
jgi:hypothetical protein